MTSTTGPLKPVGTGGFLNPEMVSNEFGIREGMIVSDFGCGTGYFAILIAQKIGKDGRVYALDILDSALDSVRARAREENLNNIETIRTNLEVSGSSSLADSSQDLVLLTNILFQSNKKEQIIKEAARVLKDNGRLIILDWKKGVNGFGPPDYLRTSEGDMQLLAEKEGFKFVRSINAGDFHYGIIVDKNRSGD